MKCKRSKLSDFGFTEGINEVIAVTAGKGLNAAPIGIIVDDAHGNTARARLFPSHTRENIENGSPMWANVCFDAVLFVISAFEDPAEEFYTSIDPPILKGSAAYCKFECSLEGSKAILRFAEGKILNRPLRAVNRGFNAIIEATIHATRYATNRALEEKIRYCGTIVEKCGSKREKEAYRLLLEYAGLEP